MSNTPHSNSYRDFATILAQDFDNDCIFPTSILNTLRLKRLILDAEATLATIAMHISVDPVLSAAIVSFANSPVYGRKAHSVVEAISIIGLSNLYYHIFAVMQQQLLIQLPKFNKTLISLIWEHSLKVACLAYAYGKHYLTRYQANRLIMLGMLLHIDVMLIIYKSANYLIVTDDNMLQYCAVAQVLSKKFHLNIIKLYDLDTETDYFISSAYIPALDTEHCHLKDFASLCTLLQMSAQSVPISPKIALLLPKVLYTFDVDPEILVEADTMLSLFS